MASNTRDKQLYAYERAQYWLSKANCAIEAGRDARKLENKAQYWLDRLNKLEGLCDSSQEAE